MDAGEEPHEDGVVSATAGAGQDASSTAVPGKPDPGLPITKVPGGFQDVLAKVNKNLAEQYGDLGSQVSESIMSNLAFSNASLDSEFKKVGQAAVRSIWNRMRVSASSFSTLRAIADAYPALSKASLYEAPDTAFEAYSPEMKSPGSYYANTEFEIHSFDGLHEAITTLISKTSNIPLVWRGVRNADWGLHSHLYRHLMEVNGVIPPSKRPRAAQPYPDEDRMIAAEKEILRLARQDWRFDNMSSLETFARIQHAGGPTRLLDVSKNPYIGAWFAVEYDEKEEDKDARLFAIATKPVPREGREPAPNSLLQLDELGGSRDPFWHLLEDTPSRQQLDWGTGARRRIWVPPAYDPRISAQNAAFILDGVPITSNKTSAYFKSSTSGPSTYWRRSDLLASASIYARMLSPRRKPGYNAPNFAPTFSFRIKARAKNEIREFMESRFGYRKSYIYPDVAALAEHLKTLDLEGRDV
jgi:hypothetical protein